MPRVWHDGTSEHGGRDPREYDVVREPDDREGCLKLLMLLPFLVLVLISIACADTPSPSPPPPQSSVWEVCDWGEEEACTGCTLGFSWAEKDVLFYEMVYAGGKVIPGSVPASCSVVQR